jgi:hypothetical protein
MLILRSLKVLDYYSRQLCRLPRAIFKAVAAIVVVGRINYEIEP